MPCIVELLLLAVYSVPWLGCSMRVWVGNIILMADVAGPTYSGIGTDQLRRSRVTSTYTPYLVSVLCEMPYPKKPRLTDAAEAAMVIPPRRSRRVANNRPA